MSSNSIPPPQWYFGEDPALSPTTKDGLKLLMQYVWSLRNNQTVVNQTVSNISSNVANLNTTVTALVSTANNNAANNNNATPPVIFGTHAARTGNFAAASFSGFLFVETDRFQACYYSNGSQWILLEATATGSFENRYGNFNAFDAGFNYIETSRNNFAGSAPYPLYQWNGFNWNFISGAFYRNQANLTQLAGTFNSANANGGNDVGAIVNVTDFAGQLQWTSANNNTLFNWGPEDCRMHGMGPIAAEVDPSPTTGWHLYDGSNNVSYLKSDGTIGNVNLANLTSSASVAFLEFGNVSSGNTVNAAVTPIFTGNAASGTVAVSLNNTTQNNFAVGGAASALTSVTVASATFTGNNVTGTISNNGQPPSIVRRAWFRQ
jgi:hypothetical protein